MIVKIYNHLTLAISLDYFVRAVSASIMRGGGKSATKKIQRT